LREISLGDPFTDLRSEGSLDLGLMFNSRFGSRLSLLRPYVPQLSIWWPLVVYGMTEDVAREIANELEAFGSLI
jgi:hypothetical protein